jgi:hypothetical protein
MLPLPRTVLRYFGVGEAYAIAAPRIWPCRGSRASRVLSLGSTNVLCYNPRL